MQTGSIPVDTIREMPLLINDNNRYWATLACRVDPGSTVGKFDSCQYHEINFSPKR